MKSILGALLILILVFTAFGQDNFKPKQPDLPGDLMIDFGFNLLTDQSDSFPTKMWGSNSFGIYYSQRVRFNDYISFHPSIGLTLDKYAFDNDAVLIRDLLVTGELAMANLEEVIPNISVEKSKLILQYLEIPMEFRIHPFSTVSGEGFFIGLGGMAGFRIKAYDKIKFSREDKTYKEKSFEDLNTNRFRYGLQARLGFKTFHLFGKMYVNDVFDTSPIFFNANPRTFTIGLNFSGF